MRWDPWSELARRPHVVFALAPLPAATGGAVWWPRGRRAVIVVDPRLVGPERTAALAHELVHDERGPGPGGAVVPVAWAPIVARDEAAVDREVARRLVPPDELEPLARARAEEGGGLTAGEVAEWFEVPPVVAERALAELATSARTARPRPIRTVGN